MTDSTYDLVIAWAGPAWITAAITFRKLNSDARILVFDTDTFPRYKVWEVILPWAFDILKILDLLEPMKAAGFMRKIWAYYYWWKGKDHGFLLPGSKLEKNADGVYTNLWPELYAYHVDRYIYDNILIEEARKRWIEILDGVTTVQTNFLDDDHIESVTLDDVVVKGNFYINATGIYSGMIPNRIKKIVNYNFTWDICYHGYLKWARCIDHYPWLPHHTATTVWSYGNQCWFWYIPISEDLVSVWMVFKSKDNPDFIKSKDKESLLLQILHSQSEVMEAINGSEFIHHRWCPKIIIDKNWNGSASHVFWGNWVLIWDAALFTDPILSSWVTVAHRTGYYVWALLNQYFRTENRKFRSLLLDTYKEYCGECYIQFRDVIRFWYEWMDQWFDIDEFLRVWNNNIKKFGIIDQNQHNAPFFYVINWLLQTVNWTSDSISVNFDQDDYELMIQWITWVKDFIDSTDIADADILKVNIAFVLRKKLRFNGESFVLQEYIRIENQFESAFFISWSLSSFIQNVDGYKSIATIIRDVHGWIHHPIRTSNLKKDIKKMILLDLLIKIN